MPQPLKRYIDLGQESNQTGDSSQSGGDTEGAASTGRDDGGGGRGAGASDAISRSQ